MTTTLEEFRDAFQTSELLVYANESWTWSVRPQQSTLGASVLSLNRFAARMSDLTEREALDLRDALTKMEAGLRSAFGFEKFNYLMLMMVDDHLHYHCIPRYSQPKDFGGRAFPDTGWPKFPALGDDAASGDQAVLKAIAEHLKKTL